MELNSNLTTGNTITLGSKNGITAYYRKNVYSVIVYINGTCNHGSLAVGGEIVLGTLPTGARPAYKIYSYITINLVLAVHPNGNVVLRNEHWEAISPNGWTMQQGLAFIV